MNIFEVLLVAPIVNVMVLFYKVFDFLNIPGPMGWAIIGVTAAVRLAINPLMQHQVEQSQNLQKIQPQLQKLQKKYKDQPMKLQQAQLELYRSHKINPGYGCLIFILQIPVFIGLYNALARVVTNGGGAQAISAINSMLYAGFLKLDSLDVGFLGFRLNKTPAEWQEVGWWYLLIPVVTGASQFYQAYLSGKMMPKKEPNPKDKKKDEPDMQSMMQKQMMFLFPAMIAWISFRFPAGLALYWNIFTLFGIWQYQKQISKAKSEAPKK